VRRCAAVGLAVAVAGLALASGGCGAKKSVEVGAAASASAAPAVAARRPTRRYYLARTADRCEVYSVDGDDFSEPQKTPCPQELEPGERFRITGRTCIRESTDPAREVPVVCPDPLTNLEKRDRKAAASATAP
jgi:hypothetical protein